MNQKYAQCPSAPCPKCGAVEWNGPRFRPTREVGLTNVSTGRLIDIKSNRPECLEWECGMCRYVAETQCLDAPAEAGVNGVKP